MDAGRLGNLFIQVILHVLRAATVNSEGRCLTGGFFFALGRNMVENHALHGHAIRSVTVTEPTKCFTECRMDCRCISFNFRQSGSGDNCQLNEENRYTNYSALKFALDWNYYDLVIDYDINANAPFVDCQNGCCGNNPCLNGGTCRETCDVIGKRFTCDCGSRATGKLCETAICSTQDWLRYQNSCFKLVTEPKSWLAAQQSCVSINSTLASIHNSEENDIVHQFAVANKAGVWIGLSNLYTSDLSFEWVDGSEVSFTDWQPGEPSYVYQIYTSENCTEMSDAGWNDLDRNRSLSYVCGKDFHP